MPIRTTRLCAGEYKVTDGTNTVNISLMDFWDGPGWIAAAEWDSGRYTDPLDTKRRAVELATYMLETANATDY